MLDWSYANGVGFNHFHVWCGSNSQGLSRYKELGFEQIVANLQHDYPATSTSLSATILTTTAYINQNFTIKGTLSVGFTGIDSQTITLQRSKNNAPWNNVTTTVTNPTGGYQFSQNESVAATYSYRTVYDGSETHTNVTSGVVSVRVSVFTLASSPAVSAQDANSLDVFVQGTDNALWYRHYQAGSGRSSWQYLGGKLTSAPAAVSRSAGKIDVFVRGTDGAIWTRSTTNGGTSWSGWSKIAAQLLAGTGPAAYAWGDARIGVFVTGTNKGLYHISYDASGPWSSWQNLGGVLTSSPAATSPTSGVIDVYGRGSNGALYQKEYKNNGWLSWESLSGKITPGTGPAACSWGPGRLDVFVQGTDGALWYKAWTGSTWSSWQYLGGKLTSSPAAATALGTSRIDAFVRGGDNGLWQKTLNGVWSGWTSVGDI
jgi:hypothetical protein